MPVFTRTFPLSTRPRNAFTRRVGGGTRRHDSPLERNRVVERADLPRPISAAREGRMCSADGVVASVLPRATLATRRDPEVVRSYSRYPSDAWLTTRRARAIAFST